MIVLETYFSHLFGRQSADPAAVRAAAGSVLGGGGLPPDDLLAARTRTVAEEYKRLGIQFGTTLENAAENLYMFVRYPGMDPTNNESERMLHKVVTRRRIRQKSVAAEWMRRFGVRLSCMLVWGRRTIACMT